MILLAFVSCRKESDFTSYYNYQLHRDSIKNANLMSLPYEEYGKYTESLELLSNNNKEYLIPFAMALCETDDSIRANDVFDEIQDVCGVKEKHFAHWSEKCQKYIQFRSYDSAEDIDKSLLDSLSVISERDQRYRKKDPIDWSRQTPLDDINIRSFREILPSYIQHFHEIRCNSEVYDFVEPAIQYGHSEFSKSAYIEEEILQACKDNLVPWEEMESVCIQRMFKFAVSKSEGKRYFNFKYLFYDENNIDFVNSALELNSLVMLLEQNPHEEITILYSHENRKALADQLSAYFEKRGIDVLAVKKSDVEGLADLAYTLE